MEEDTRTITPSMIFTRVVQVLRQRPSIVVPFIGANLLASIIFLALLGLFPGPALPEGQLPRTQLFLAFVIGMVLQSLAFGMATLMAWRQINAVPDTFWQSFAGTLRRAFQTVTAGLLLGTATAVGMAFFVLPGLAIACVFMFTFVYITVEERQVFEAMRGSFVLVKRRFSEALTLFLLIVALSIVVVFLGTALMRLSLMGQFLNTLMVSVLFGGTATSLVAFYKETQKLKEEN